MNWKSLTWPQVALVVALLAATFAAHRFLGLNAGMASGFVTTLIAFLLGRAPAPGGES